MSYQHAFPFFVRAFSPFQLLPLEPMAHGGRGREGEWRWERGVFSYRDTGLLLDICIGYSRLISASLGLFLSFSIGLSHSVLSSPNLVRSHLISFFLVQSRRSRFLEARYRFLLLSLDRSLTLFRSILFNRVVLSFDLVFYCSVSFFFDLILYRLISFSITRSFSLGLDPHLSLKIPASCWISLDPAFSRSISFSLARPCSRPISTELSLSLLYSKWLFISNDTKNPKN